MDWLNEHVPPTIWVWLQMIVTALIIIAVTWALATAAKWAFAKLFAHVPHLNRQSSTGQTLGTSLGTIASLLIWLFGLIALLQVFNLNGVILPLQALLNQFMAFIPRLIGAGLIFFVGLMIAKIVKQLVVTALGAMNFDRWVGRAGGGEVLGSGQPAAAGMPAGTAPQLASVIGTVVYVLIIIPVAIAALDALNIEAVSQPATDMLRMILAAVPLILGAAILLGIGFFIARWVASLLESILPSLGVDRALSQSGLVPAGTSASHVLALIAMTAIMLFAGIAATRMLNFPELSLILDQILTLGGRVIFGSVVIGVGVILANVISRLIASSTGENGVVPTMIRYLIIGVATFMGLTFMEIGEQIVVIAFTGFVVAVSVASALAFGLGGRYAAARTLEDLRARAPAVPAQPTTATSASEPMASTQPPTPIT